MFGDAAENSHIRASSGSRPGTIGQEMVGFLVMLCDAAVLYGAAVAAHLVHVAIWGKPTLAATTIFSTATVPAALFVAALHIDGAYRFEIIRNFRGLARRAASFWAVSLIMFVAICSLLGASTEVGPAEFVFLSVAALAAYLLHRLIVARLVNRLVAAGRIKTSVVFIVAEDGERARSIGHEKSRFHVFLLPSFAHAEPARLRQLVAMIRASAADEIHLVTRSATLDDCKTILAELRKLPLPVKLVANPMHAELLRCPLTKCGADIAFEVQRAPLNRPERFFKRGFDVVVSIVLIAALFPLLAVVYALVPLTSRGPALFRQTRRGFNGRLFTIYKFRTMTVAENGEQIRQAQRNDLRVTWLGRILRKTSVDELPQLFNVLSGDMSLIGPRPHAAAHDDAFTTLVASYAARQRVKPGITGWAQVCGCRGETSTPDAVERRTALDLFYIERWSMWLDLWIFLRTFFAVAFPKNAY